MIDWLLLIGGIVLILMIITYYYFFKYLKPIPKPNIKFQELDDPPDKIKFSIWNNVNEPALVDLRVYFEILYISYGKPKRVVIRGESIIQTKNITRESPGEWEIDNFLDELRFDKDAEISQIMIKILFKDSDGRKYCYCGIFQPNEVGYWETKEYNEFYVRYKFFKCMFCLFRNQVPRS